MLVTLGATMMSLPAIADDKANSFFVDHTGVPTLTNRPHEYRSDESFEEVHIKYEPIYTPDRYDFSSKGHAPTEADYRSIIRRYARYYRLNDALITAVIKAESNFDRYAVSKSGAQGLMQLMPATAASMSVRDSFDPVQNIAGGTQYLYKLLDLFDDNLDLALAAYNAGPGTVKKYGKIPPFKETREYVARVKRYRDEFASGNKKIQVKAGTYRPLGTVHPSEEAPFVVHFKDGGSQPAHRVSDQGDEYLLVYGRRRFSIAKSLIKTIEELSP